MGQREDLRMTTQAAADLLARGYSRRGLFRAAALAAGGATLPFYNEAALAQRSFVEGAPADAVMINANENPLGPCTDALAAMSEVLKKGGRYRFEEVIRLQGAQAAAEGLQPSQVQAFAGSSDPLHRSVLAFCSPERAFVTGDPTYESGEMAARHVAKARTVRVPLTKTYAHDVKAMVEQGGKDVGLYYVCNPNNPTGTVTPREDLEWLVANKAPGSVVLIDEAYLHFCDEKSCTPLVAAGKDVIILRTWSKIYGMAGLRAGVAMAKPELLDKLRQYGQGFLPTTGMVGARVSLETKGLVAERKKIVKDTRESLFDWLRSKNYSFVPSVSNHFMLDAKRPGREAISAMASKKVVVGRVWPSWPTHFRVTIGTPEEMEKFKSALTFVMA